MPAPTNSEVEIALRLKDEASASFQKFVNDVHGGANSAEREISRLSQSAGAGKHAVDGLTEAMREDRLETRRNKFLLGELNGSLYAVEGAFKSVGLGGDGLFRALGKVSEGAAIGIDTFDGLGAMLGPAGFGGPVALAATGAVALGVAIAAMASEAEQSAEKILTTAEAVKALDDAYAEYSSKFKGGAGNAAARKAQMDVAEQDAAALQRMANNMSTYVKVWTSEVVQMRAETINGMYFDDEQLSGKSLLNRLKITMPEVHKIYSEFLASVKGDEDEAQAKFFDEFHNVQARLRAAQAVALSGIEETDNAKVEKSKETYARLTALDIAYINDAQKRRYDEMVQTAETVRLFMQQSESGRQALLEENNDAFVQRQLSGMKGVAKVEFAQVDAAILEIDDGWKTFLSGVDAGVESLAQSISQGFAKGWEDAFGEANSVLEKFLQAVYTEVMATLARIAAQKAITSILSMIPGIGGVIASAAAGAAMGSAGAGVGSNSKGRIISSSDLVGQQAGPSSGAGVVVNVTLRGTLSGQRFLQDEMPSYGQYLSAKAV